MKRMFDSKNERLIAETVFDQPDESFHLRGLAEAAGVSPSTVSRLLERFESRGLVEVERGVAMEITASHTEVFRDFKKAFNLWRLAESGLIEDLWDETIPEAIVLFGSYAKGEDDGESDVDIAIVNGRDLDIDLSEYEEKLARQVTLHGVDREEADRNCVETLANGIVLRGYLET
jgi:DNA-binding MarR family transcriptional regulator